MNFYFSCRGSNSFGLYLVLWAIVHSTEGKNCRKLDFNPEISGKRLVNHLIDTKKASTEDFCQVLCYMNDKCVSINFNQTEDQDGLHSCELNDLNEESHPEHLKKEDGFSYRGSKTPCASNPCKGSAICQTGFTADGYRCVCPAGFTGSACDKDIDECATSSPCHANANCTNTQGSYVCKCSTGYQGNGIHCEDIDECATSPCHARANCVNTPGSYVCSCTTGYQGNGSHCEAVGLFFPTGIDTDYVTCPNCTVPSLQAFTFCFWMRTNDTSGRLLTLFSYYGKQDDLAIGIYKNRLLAWYYFGVKRYYDVGHFPEASPVTDGAWHHICLTRKKIARSSAQIYKDDVQIFSGTGIYFDPDIPGGGVVILGQDQGNRGGGLDSTQAFVGSLSLVNLWDRVIPPDEISRMYKACTADEGNVIKWPDFMSGIKGNVKIIKPPHCNVPDVQKPSLFS